MAFAHVPSSHHPISATPNPSSGSTSGGSPYTTADSKLSHSAARTDAQFMNWPWPLNAAALSGGGGAEDTHVESLSLPPQLVAPMSDVKVVRGTEQLETPGARQSPRRKTPVREDTP